MSGTVAERSHVCLQNLRTIIDALASPDRTPGRVLHQQVVDELERFSLWIGNIGALNPPQSSLSLEYRLQEADDVLSHIYDLLDDLDEVTQQRM